MPRRERGYCTIEYSGPDAPDDLMTPEQVAGGAQWVDLLSNIAAEFQGYITATCEFRNAYGFAFITDSKTPTLAQGYLAVKHGVATRKAHRAAAPLVRKEPYARD